MLKTIGPKGVRDVTGAAGRGGREGRGFKGENVGQWGRPNRDHGTHYGSSAH